MSTDAQMEVAVTALVNTVNRPGSWNPKRGEVGFVLRDGFCDFSAGLRAAIDAAVALERERCAKIADAAVDPEWPNDDQSLQCKAIAAEIRAPVGQSPLRNS